MKKNTRTKEQWEQATAASKSVAQVLKALDLFVGGANYKGFYRNVTKFGLDISHFSGKGWNKGNSPGITIPLSEILVERSTYSNSNNLKKRLIREGVKEHRCESCDLVEWLGEPIPIELDHINGIGHDNRETNLRILCPNCHALTQTYCGKNIGKSRSLGGTLDPEGLNPSSSDGVPVGIRERVPKLCDCGKELPDVRAVQCRKCYKQSRKKT